MKKIITPKLSSLFIAFVSLLLIACGNESSTNNQTLTRPASIQKYKKDTVLSGKVNTKKSKINSGTVSVTDSKNKTITSTKVSEAGHYRVEIPANTELPIILNYQSDDNDNISLKSVAIFAALKKYDINDLTTLIAKKAKSLGGYTASNMTVAADSTVGVPDANKTSTGFRGDPTAQYGGWH